MISGRETQRKFEVTQLFFINDGNNWSIDWLFSLHHLTILHYNSLTLKNRRREFFSETFSGIYTYSHLPLFFFSINRSIEYRYCRRVVSSICQVSKASRWFLNPSLSKTITQWHRVNWLTHDLNQYDSSKSFSLLFYFYILHPSHLEIVHPSAAAMSNGSK